MSEYNKYLGHMKRTKSRKDRLGNPIQFKLTFEEWSQIWDESGHSHERGTRKGQYVMARLDDLGHYEVGNVKIQLSSENFREAAKRGHECCWKGKKLSRTNGEEWVQKLSQKMKAIRAEYAWSTRSKKPNDGRKRPLTEEHKQRMREGRERQKREAEIQASVDR